MHLNLFHRCSQCRLFRRENLSKHCRVDDRQISDENEIIGSSFHPDFLSDRFKLADASWDQGNCPELYGFRNFVFQEPTLLAASNSRIRGSACATPPNIDTCQPLKSSYCNRSRMKITTLSARLLLLSPDLGRVLPG